MEDMSTAADPNREVQTGTGDQRNTFVIIEWRSRIHQGRAGDFRGDGDYNRSMVKLFPLGGGRVSLPRRLPSPLTIKSAVAALLSFVAADALVSGAPPVLAPLTALLVVQSTLYETLTSGLQRVGSVVAGVLVAVLVSTVVGLTWWSLGLVVLVSLLIGQRLRLGGQLMEVPISAMLVLAVAWHPEVAAAGRMYETVIGAVVGVGVKLLTPPVYVRSAGDSIRELAQRTAGLLREMAADLEQGPPPERADHWLAAAWNLDRPVQQAHDALRRAEDSLRLNPRGGPARAVPRRLHPGLTALEQAAIHLRVICRTLTDGGHGLRKPDPGPDVRVSLAQLFDASADAVDEFGRLVSRDVSDAAADPALLRAELDGARLDLHDVGEQLLVDAARDRAAWQDNGALLAHVDRLLQEVDPDRDDVSVAVSGTFQPPPRLRGVRLPAAARERPLRFRPDASRRPRGRSPARLLAKRSSHVARRRAGARRHAAALRADAG